MIGGARDPRSGVEAQIEGTPATTFGKYQLFASLGRGGMAEVFLSVACGQMGFNKLVVIKRLRQSLAEDPAFRTMFLDEARLAARLSHPNIVHTYEVGEQNGVYFIAMEYLEGQSLNKVLREALRHHQGVAPEVGVRIIADALGGLAYAHSLADYDGRPLGVIHRDVSPHNIIVTYDGHTKLVDFGIAKAALSSAETEVGVLKGKVAYMSPEQAIGGRIDQRADLFAMGIVLWELLARRRLMTGENAANTLHKLMNEPIPRLSAAVPGIDPDLEAIAEKALEKDANDRWQSASEMRDALEIWLRTSPRPARQDDVGQTMLSLFAPLREDVQRQIQNHMASIALATNTQELKALTASSLQSADAQGGGQLLRLGAGSGSGSGVVPHSGFEPHPSGLSPGFRAMGSQSIVGLPLALPSSAPAKGSSALLIVIAVGFFVLAGLLIVVLGFRGRYKDFLLAERAPAHTSSGDTSAAPGPRAAPGTLPAALSSASGVPPASNADMAAAPTATALTTAASSAVAPTATPANVGVTPTVRPVRPPPPVVRPAIVRVAPPAPPPSPPEEKENGFLTITVYPWAKVSEGARVLCASTPCNKIPLSPGAHTLALENPDQSLKQSTTVMIKSGETTTRAIGLK